MAIIDSLAVFVVSFLVGASGIYLGGWIITNTGSFEKAAITALAGALVWAIAGLLFGWIPFLGPLLALIAYVGVRQLAVPGRMGERRGNRPDRRRGLGRRPLPARTGQPRRVRGAGCPRGVIATSDDV